MSNDDIASVIASAENFLRQEQGLYGNVIYRSPVRELPAPAASAASAPAPAPMGVPIAAPVAVVAPVSTPAPVATPVPSAGRVHEPPPAAASPGSDDWHGAPSLAALNASICGCKQCPLGATRTKFVFGVGRPDADVMIIGEAPGADEDATGEPFVGAAGQLLNKILEAVNFARADVFIANILKCRPPNNRNPLPAEVALCEPYLWKQVELVKPKIILCLGLVAAKTLLQTKSALGPLRETVQTYRGIPLIVTYHPAALLRNPGWKRPTWEDVKKLRKMYDDINAAG